MQAFKLAAESVAGQEGGALVEYILLVVLVALAAISGMTFLGEVEDNKINNIGVQIG